METEGLDAMRCAVMGETVWFMGIDSGVFQKSVRSLDSIVV